MKHLPNYHPGECLRTEFLDKFHISLRDLAVNIGVPEPDLDRLVQGKGRVTPDLAIRLSRALGTSAYSWMRMQADFDVDELSRSESTGAIRRMTPEWHLPKGMHEPLLPEPAGEA